MCASILYPLKIETQMDDKQVCVRVCVYTHVFAVSESIPSTQ